MERDEFWKSCMLVGPDRNIRRMVAKSEVSESGEFKRYDSPDHSLRIFIPNGPDDDFNLVLSLCENGQHAWMLDLDMQAEALWDGALAVTERGSKRVLARPDRFGLGYPWVLLPSSTNWHAYCADMVSWGDMMAVNADFATFNVDFKKWNDVSCTKGFYALRPPWVLKPEAAKTREAAARKRAEWDRWEAFLKAGGSLKDIPSVRLCPMPDMPF